MPMVRQISDSWWPSRVRRRTAHRAAVLVIGSALWFVSTATTPAAADDLVTLLDATATLPPDGVAQVTFPLTAAEGVQLTDVKPSVLRLRRGEVEVGVPDDFTAA